jgi:uncharacterized protein Veg
MSWLPREGSCSARPAIQRQLEHGLGESARAREVEIARTRDCSITHSSTLTETYPSSNIVRSSRGDADGIADWDVRLVPVPLYVHDALGRHECAQCLPGERGSSRGRCRGELCIEMHQ